MKRLRCSHIVVQPVFVWDDGEELTPGPQAQPIQTSLAGLANIGEQLRVEMAGISEAVERPCRDCQARPGQPHEAGCDVARCTVCGGQRITCPHEDQDVGWNQIYDPTSSIG